MKCLPLVRLSMKSAYVLTRVYRFIARPINVAVKIMLVRDGRVLLVKHTYRSGWYLPGGGVKRRETLEEAARREAREEVGATIHHLSLFGVYSGIRGCDNDHIAVFVSEAFDLADVASLEIEEIAFYDMDNLPDDVARAGGRRIAEYLSDPTGSKRFGKW